MILTFCAETQASAKACCLKDYLMMPYLNYKMKNSTSYKIIKSTTVPTHYENTPIQIYRKFHLQKLNIFQIKTLIFFIFLLKT